MEDRLKLRLSRMFRSSFGSCRSRNITDIVTGKHQQQQQPLLSPTKSRPFPGSICRPKCPDTTTLVNSFAQDTAAPLRRKVSAYGSAITNSRSGLRNKSSPRRPPAFPISPTEFDHSAYYDHGKCNYFRVKKKEEDRCLKNKNQSKKKKKKKRTHSRRRSDNVMSNNASILFSSTSTSQESFRGWSWFSSDDDDGGADQKGNKEEDHETDTLFSSKSTATLSSDSSSFRRQTHRRRRRSAAARKQGGGCSDEVVPPANEDDYKVKDSFAVVKRSSDPYNDFRTSMVEMIVEKQIFGAKDLEKLLQCFLSLNSLHHHRIILEVFTEIWEALFSNWS